MVSVQDKTTSLIGEAKLDYYSNVVEENTWRLCETLKIIEICHGQTYEPEKIAQGFAHYFTTAVQKIRSGFLAPRRRSTISPRTRHAFKLSTVSEDFVRTELREIKTVSQILQHVYLRTAWKL